MPTNSKEAYFPNKIRRPGGGSKVGRFVLYFLEMQIPMTFGGARMLPARSSDSCLVKFHGGLPSGYLPICRWGCSYLAIPVVMWMIFRGHGWRLSLEMGIAMIAPVAMILVLGQFTAYDYRTWLLVAGYPAMCLGMLVYMLYRRDHFMEREVHSTHTADLAA